MDGTSRRRPGPAGGLLLLATALALAARPGAGADAVPGKVLKAALQRYRDTVAKLRWASNDGNIAALYSQALAFGPRRGADLANETDDYLAGCTDAQRVSLREALPGLEVGEPGTAPSPDLDAFLEQSKASKTKASREFFELLRKVHPGRFGLAYRRDPPGDGCTLFGTGTLTELYGRIRAVENAKRSLPYRGLLEGEAQAILRELTGSQCACGGVEDVERELRRFVKSFPKDPAAPSVQRRLDGIRAPSSALEPHCLGLDLP